MSTPKIMPVIRDVKTASLVSISDTSQKALALAQHGGRSIQFSGGDTGLCERHLVFDNVVDRTACDACVKFEALARAVLEVLSQRWILTERTYQRLNPKRIYYLSIEYLLGRSLSNNIINLMLDPFVQESVRKKDIDRRHLVEQEPDAGLGNGGLGRLAARLLNFMATLLLSSSMIFILLRNGLRTLHESTSIS